MFAIAYFVGLKRGGWIKSSDRFPTEDSARRSITVQVAHERSRDLTPMMRRAVSV